jgi:hypothetical protein
MFCRETARARARHSSVTHQKLSAGAQGLQGLHMGPICCREIGSWQSSLISYESRKATFRQNVAISAILDSSWPS